MTATIQVLSDSPEFWKRRSEEQLAYIKKYSSSPHTRPDHESVLASANIILDKCLASIARASGQSENGVGPQ